MSCTVTLFMHHREPHLYYSNKAKNIPCLLTFHGILQHNITVRMSHESSSTKFSTQEMRCIGNQYTTGLFGWNFYDYAVSHFVVPDIILISFVYSAKPISVLALPWVENFLPDKTVWSNQCSKVVILFTPDESCGFALAP